MTNYISTENTQYDEKTTRAIVDELKKLGWNVEYGEGLPWQFESEWERDDFEMAWIEAERKATSN